MNENIKVSLVDIRVHCNWVKLITQSLVYVNKHYNTLVSLNPYL